MPLFDKHTMRILQQHADTIRLVEQNANVIETARKEFEAVSKIAPTPSEFARLAQAFQSFKNIRPVIAFLEEIQPYLEKEPDEQEVLVQDETDLFIPDTRLRIAHYSPSFAVLEKLLQGNIDLDALHWREFEELVADLLSKDGYYVKLGPGKNDGGKDIIAVKEVENIGPVMAVWQAKKLNPGNKVGIGVIRELADTCHENKASKGVIVTTTFLTKSAIERVQRDKYILNKMDRDDLMKWIRRIQRKSRGSQS